VHTEFVNAVHSNTNLFVFVVVQLVAFWNAGFAITIDGLPDLIECLGDLHSSPHPAERNHALSASAFA
jgi:hypothetical protein